MNSFLQGRRLTLLVAALLLLTTFSAYFGVWNNSFVELDDQFYVFHNPHVKAGFTWSTIQWAFTHFHAQNWHPLTWISHALDVQIYGLNAGGHHVTNLIFHMLNTVLVFVVLRRMTGSMWRGALVAALFGVHPLHVESVAWISERKDVLSGFFFLLTLYFYNEYIRRKSTTGKQKGDLTTENTESTEGKLTRRRQDAKRDLTTEETENTEEAGDSLTRRREDAENSNGSLAPFFASWRLRVILFYLLALLFFALGLMSKPMLVTVPFVLLLLDWWPLERFDSAGKRFTQDLWRLAREKIPFFALSFVSCIITLQAQQSAMAPTQQYPVSYRIENAARSACVYIQQTFWPENLTVFYPHSEVTSDQLRTAALALVLITVAALMYSRKARFLASGWFWYLGMLVPVIGIVQVGSQAHADRYTYLPHIGFFIACAWGLGLAAERFKPGRLIFGPSLAIAVCLLAVIANGQVKHWRNSVTLFTHGAKVNPQDYLARCILARNIMEAGQVDEAIRQLEVILREVPRYPLAEFILASALQRQGRMEEAIPHLLNVEFQDYVTARNSRLVLSYLYTGDLAKAQEAIAPLVQTSGKDPAVWLVQAAILRQAGDYAEAQRIFCATVDAHGPPPPADNPVLDFEVGELYAIDGKPEQAVRYYERAVQMGPNYTNAFNNYAWVLSTSVKAEVRDGRKAVKLAERACELSQWKVPVMIGTLAAAYAEAGRFEDAVKTAEKARDLARTQGQEEVAKRNEELMELYRAGKSYRE